MRNLGIREPVGFCHDCNSLRVVTSNVKLTSEVDFLGSGEVTVNSLFAFISAMFENEIHFPIIIH